MAKISTYPNVGTPVLSDMLIGTDVTDSNATKNFMISDILGLIGSLGLYVPYTGATANVNLGSFNLSAQDLTLSGDANFNGAVYVNYVLFDVTSSPGFAGQILTATGTGIQWVNLSSLTLNLQQVLDDGNTANQNIILTGASNKIEQTGVNAVIDQTGANAYFSQAGVNAFIEQTGATSKIQQAGINAEIKQTAGVGSAARIIQSGENSYFSQTGANAYIEQIGATSKIEQTGATSKIKQSGNSALIEQTGANPGISQIGANAYIEQTGANAYIEQTGVNSFIKQNGAGSYILQVGTTGYMQPAQIKDSAGLFGVADNVLVSLGPNNGVEWQDKNQMGYFYDTTAQLSPTANTARPIQFNTNSITGFGVSITNDTAVQPTQIIVNQRGFYNIEFSAQVRNGTSDTTISIWLEKNGSNVVYSNRYTTLAGSHYDAISFNYFILLDVTDILRIMWSHDNSAQQPQLATQGAVAPHPATPSAILTVNRVR